MLNILYTDCRASAALSWCDMNILTFYFVYSILSMWLTSCQRSIGA